MSDLFLCVSVSPWQTHLKIQLNLDGEEVKMAKYVYFFGNGEAEGRGDMKNLLGGKGANLAEMTSIGLPVPAGFTISTDVCTEFYKNDRNYPAGLEAEVNQHLAQIEHLMDKKFACQAYI
mgnify:CR=1 FL=1